MITQLPRDELIFKSKDLQLRIFLFDDIIHVTFIYTVNTRNFHEDQQWYELNILNRKELNAIK